MDLFISTSAASPPRWTPTTPHRIPTRGEGSTPSSATTAWPSRPAPGPCPPGCPRARPATTARLPRQKVIKGGEGGRGDNT
ncbi:hypothetical protein DV515_00006756 [Chloebia gouldiae]|uniref:Uncharacterized protein n=1 Tax=Chloebia gouldiae TaxID=44316 RepID=A0A3L8SJ82_CHLGU|nr:hypothetical protein DV515_00006756 [Chloebia gouldiae]